MEYGEEEGNFDVVIVNDDLDAAYGELREFAKPELPCDPCECITDKEEAEHEDATEGIAAEEEEGEEEDKPEGGGSCACDPCTCDPCTCPGDKEGGGDDQPGVEDVVDEEGDRHPHHAAEQPC